MGQQVMAAQNGCYILLEQGGQMLLQTFREEIITSRQMRVVRQSIFAQRVEKSAVTGLVYIGTQSATEITNTGVPQAAQMSHRQVHALSIVHTHVTCVGVSFDVVVQQHGGGVGGLQIVQPYVRKGQPQEQRPNIVVFEHIFVVAGVFLGFVIQGDHLYQVA